MAQNGINTQDLTQKLDAMDTAQIFQPTDTINDTDVEVRYSLYFYIFMNNATKSYFNQKPKKKIIIIIIEIFRTSSRT